MSWTPCQSHHFSRGDFGPLLFSLIGQCCTSGGVWSVHTWCFKKQTYNLHYHLFSVGITNRTFTITCSGNFGGFCLRIWTCSIVTDISCVLAFGIFFWSSFVALTMVRLCLQLQCFCQEHKILFIVWHVRHLCHYCHVWLQWDAQWMTG